MAVLGLVGLVGAAVIPAAAETPEVTGALSAAPLDAAIASKAEQLAAMKRNIVEADCDYAVDAAIIEGCDQLTAQVEKLTAELDALKALAAEARLPRRRRGPSPIPSRRAPVPI